MAARLEMAGGASCVVTVAVEEESHQIHAVRQSFQKFLQLQTVCQSFPVFAVAVEVDKLAHAEGESLAVTAAVEKTHLRFESYP